MSVWGIPSKAAFVTVALLSSAAATGSELVDRIVAVVDREAITQSEAEEARRLGLLRGRDTTEMADVVERLIESYLIQREVDRFPAEPISPEEITKAVDGLRTRFDSASDFEAVLESQGLDIDGLRVLLRRQIRISRYLERRFRPLVYVTIEEVRRYYEEELLPDLRASGDPMLSLAAVEEPIRRILEERQFNRRLETWIQDLKARARIRRYVW